MKEHGDLFKAELVRALLNTKPGTIGESIDPSKPAKGQTRRVIKPGNSRVNGEPSNRYDWTRFDFTRAEVDPLSHPVLKVPYMDPDGTEQIHNITPKRIEGDGMWVKETFIHAHGVGGYAEGVDPNTDPHGPTIDIIYRADDGANERTAGPWTPSIFMTKKLSRISMEIVDVWPEQLQSISVKAAKSEGIESSWSLSRNPSTIYRDYLHKPYDKYLNIHNGYTSSVSSFRSLWDSINGKDYPWKSNPWVWVREFKMKEHK